jgi:imidazolonepropionase-like amidohydrolase
MKRLNRSLMLTALLIGGAHAAAEAAAPIAITHVTIIDTRGGPSSPDRTVVVSGDRITSVDDSGASTPPKAARLIDGRGKYLIPGLWDMHVHMFLQGADVGDVPPNIRRHFSLFLANGVTGVRDLGAMPKFFDAYIQGKRAGQLPAGVSVAPRIWAAGEIIDGTPPYVSGMMLSVKNGAEARQAVDQNKERGSDFIKVYSYLSREEYFAIADEAKKQGLTFVGHVPYTVSAAEASDAGQKSLEHADGVLLASSREENQIRKTVLDGVPQSHTSELKAFELYFVDEHYLPIKSYDAQKAAALFERFKRNGTWVCPTLIVTRQVTLANEEQYTGALTERYEPAATRDAWRKFMKEIDFPPEERAKLKEVYEKLVAVVRDMQRAGVGILAGTDEPVAYVLPGFSLHEELEIFVSAGLTPLEALQTATLNPARFLGREQDLGTVEKGKLADLVLLSADPLLDIHNTSKIEGVFANGQYLSKAALAQLMRGVAADAQKGE